METMTVRQSSGDDRIGALERKVDDGFLRVDHRFELVDQRFDHVDARFKEIDRRFEQVDQRFEQVDQRFEQVDKRFEQVDQRFGRIEGGLRELRVDMKSGFDLIHERLHAFQRTMILFYGAIIAALLGVLGAQL